MKKHFAYQKQGMEFLKIAWRLDHSVIPVGILLSLVEILQIYLGLFLSAEIIDELLQKDYQGGMIYAGILVGANLLLGVGKAWLTMQRKERNESIDMAFTEIIREKVLHLDYESMEDADKIGNVKAAELKMRFQGGMASLLLYYQQGLSILLNMVASVILIVILCFSVPKKGNAFVHFIGQIPVSVVLLCMVLGGIGIFLNRVMGNMNRKFQEISEKHPEAEKELAYIIEDIITKYEAGKVIRLFAMKSMIMENIKNKGKEQNKLFTDMMEWYFNMKALQGGMGCVFRAFSYFLVSVKVLAGAVSIGSFTKYAGALVQFGQSVSQLLELEPQIKQICMGMEYFLEFLKLPNMRETGSIPIEKRLDNEYELEFHDVSFRYPGTDEMILNHVNCKIALKEKMAVVGRNGAGKTTFIKLLCRLYDPTEGYITLNGVDIRKYDYKEYMSIFGVVFQDYSLFAFSVGENVATENAINPEKVWKCLEKAGVKDVVEQMPKGLDTPLYHYEEQGVEVSGGEAQKIAIARALYKDAPFVILDEPTAALDPISEYEIYKRFDEMVEDKTSIYISHRMSSCRFCNDILVFEQGKIVERGSHEQLLKQDGCYTKLWNAQAKYYA